MQNIIPCLWFDKNAEEAVNFYVSVFKDGKILKLSHYGEEGLLEKGSVMAITFRMNGQEFFALNGGSHFNFTPAVSFMINCTDQKEIDYYWDKLSEGGKPGRCGWLDDKFGLTWQVVPTVLGEMMTDPDQQKSGKVIKALFQMDKLDIAGLKKAFET